jgi:hypothetical protein
VRCAVKGCPRNARKHRTRCTEHARAEAADRAAKYTPVDARPVVDGRRRNRCRLCVAAGEHERAIGHHAPTCPHHAAA